MSGWDKSREYGSPGGRVSLLASIAGAILLSLLVVTCSANSHAQSVIAGTASVIDGDTIVIHGTHIRLSGIDAPEHLRRCGAVNVGQSAALALDDLVQSRTVSCAVSNLDRYGRSVAVCSIGGADLGRIMVAQGWARDWPRYSHRAYANDEATARAARRGLWGLQCPANLWGNRNYN